MLAVSVVPGVDVFIWSQASICPQEALPLPPPLIVNVKLWLAAVPTPLLAANVSG